MNNILLINGPNLNLLGKRESSLYGVESLSDLENMCKNWAKQNNSLIECIQSNHEGEIIDAIQSSGKLEEDIESQLKQVIEGHKKK